MTHWMSEHMHTQTTVRVLMDASWKAMSVDGVAISTRNTRRRKRPRPPTPLPHYGL